MEVIENNMVDSGEKSEYYTPVLTKINALAKEDKNTIFELKETVARLKQEIKNYEEQMTKNNYEKDRLLKQLEEFKNEKESIVSLKNCIEKFNEESEIISNEFKKIYEIHKIETAEAVEKHQKEITELRIYFQEKCLQMEKQYSEEVIYLSTTLSEKNSEIEELTENLGSGVDSLTSNSLSIEYEKKIAALQETIQNIKKEGSRTSLLKAVNQALLTIDSEVEENWPTELLELRNKFTSSVRREIQELKHKHDLELNSLKEKHDSNLNIANRTIKQHEEKIKKLEEIYKQSIQSGQAIKSDSENRQSIKNNSSIQEEHIEKTEASSENFNANSSILKRTKMEPRETNRFVAKRIKISEDLRVFDPNSSVSDDASIEDQKEDDGPSLDSNAPLTLSVDESLKLKNNLTNHREIEEIALQRAENISIQSSPLKNKMAGMEAEKKKLQQTASKKILQSFIRALGGLPWNDQFDKQGALSAQKGTNSEMDLQCLGNKEEEEDDLVEFEMVSVKAETKTREESSQGGQNLESSDMILNIDRSSEVLKDDVKLFEKEKRCDFDTEFRSREERSSEYEELRRLRRELRNSEDVLKDLEVDFNNLKIKLKKTRERNFYLDKYNKVIMLSKLDADRQLQSARNRETGLMDVIFELQRDIRRSLEREIELSDELRIQKMHNDRIVPLQFVEKIKELKRLTEKANNEKSILTVKLNKIRRENEHFYGKYQRADSRCKALIFQKNYILNVMTWFRQSEINTLKFLVQLTEKEEICLTRDQTRKNNSKSFRSIVLVAISIHRMKWMVTRWQARKRLNPLCSTISQYNDF